MIEPHAVCERVGSRASRTRFRSHMPRPATGQVLTFRLSDGRTMFAIRFRAYGTRRLIRLGTDVEGWSEERARNELDQTLDRVRRGVWTPPDESRSARVDDPTFHEFASAWLARHRGGLRPRTIEDYEYRLSNHLLPFFRTVRLSEIDVPLIDAYRQTKLDERALGAAAGERTLSNDTINATIALLAQILDEAIEHKLRVELPNPARGRRRRLKSQRASRTFLEPDQASAMIEAARQLDAEIGPLNWQLVCELRASRESNLKLAADYGVSDSLISRIRRGLLWRTPATEGRRTAAVAALILAGLRIEEFCALNVGDVDRVNRRLNVEDSKTEAGVRPVKMSDLLFEEVVAHLDRLGPLKTDAPLYPNTHGERYTPSGVRSSILAPVLRRAREIVTRRGGRMPTRVTPHTLRRTFVSLMLAGGADVPLVMSQVGHADSKVTLEIYAQVVEGLERGYMARVDEMVRGASIGHTNGHKDGRGDSHRVADAVGRMAESQ